MGAHGKAFKAYLKALAGGPSEFFQTTSKYMGAYIGL